MLNRKDKNIQPTDTVDSDKKIYISLADASRYSRYSQEYLSLRARHGKLKAVKNGRNWVTTMDWVKDYENEFGICDNIGDISAGISGKVKRLLSRKAFAVAVIGAFLIASGIFAKGIGNWEIRKLVYGACRGIGNYGLATARGVEAIGEDMGKSYIGLADSMVEIAERCGEKLGGSYIGLADSMIMVSEGFGEEIGKSYGELVLSIKYRVLSGKGLAKNYFIGAIMDIAIFEKSIGGSYIGLSGEMVEIAERCGEELGGSYIGLADSMIKVSEGFGKYLYESETEFANSALLISKYSGNLLKFGGEYVNLAILNSSRVLKHSSNVIVSAGFKTIESWTNVFNNIPKDKDDFNALVEGNRDWKKLANADQYGNILRGSKSDIFGRVAGAEKKNLLAGFWNGTKAIMNSANNVMEAIVTGFGNGMGSVVDGMDSTMALVFGKGETRIKNQELRIKNGEEKLENFNQPAPEIEELADNNLESESGEEVGDGQEEVEEIEKLDLPAQAGIGNSELEIENERKEGDDGLENTKIAQGDKPSEEENIPVILPVVDGSSGSVPAKIVKQEVVVNETKVINQTTNTYNATDSSKLPITGGTITGDLIILGNTRADELAASSFVNSGNFTNTGEADFIGGIKIGSGLLKAGTPEALDAVRIGGGLVVSGNSELAGVTINGRETVNGNLIINGQTQTVGINITGSASMLSLNVSGHAQIGSLGITGSLGVNNLSSQYFSVAKDAYFGANASDTLTVNSRASFKANVAAENGLNVTGSNLTVGGSNFVVDTSGNVTMAGNLVVGGSSTAGGALTVTGQMALDSASSSMLTMADNLWSNGTTHIGDADADILNIRAGVWNLTSTATTTVAMANGLNFDSNLLVLDSNSNKIGIGTSTPSNLFTVAGTEANQLRLAYDGANYALFDVSSGGDLAINTGDTGTTTIEDMLRIGHGSSSHGIMTQAGDVYASGDFELAGVAWIDGALNASSTLNITGAVRMYNQLLVDQGVRASSTLQVTDAVRFYNTLKTDGAISASSTLGVTGAARMYDILLVDGALKASSTMQVTDAARFYSVAFIDGALSASSTLQISGASRLYNTLLVDGALRATSTLDVTGIARFYANTVFGDSSADDATFNARVASNIIPKTADTYNLGSSSLYWNELHVDTITATTTNLYGNLTVGDENVDILTLRSGDWRMTSTATTTVAMTNGINFDLNTFVIDPNSGRVGIGTSSPASALHIAGTSSPQMRLGYNGQNYTNFAIGSDGALTVTPTNNATTTIAYGFAVNTNNLIVQNATGNVGIGTTSPDVMLHIGDNVLGHLTGSEDLMLSGNMEVDGIAWFDNSLRASSTLLVTGVSTFYGNTVLGDATSDTVTYAARVASNIIPSVADSYNLGSSSLYWNELHVDTITATTTNLYGNLTVGDENVDILTLRSGDWRMTSTATTTVAMTNGINFDLNTFVIDPNSGRVGIGTSSPASALHIAGTSSPQMRLGYNGQNYTNFAIGSDGALTVTPTNNATTTIAYGFAVNTNNLIVQNATGNVGIGTTSPFAVLSVNAPAGKASFAVGSSTETYLLIDKDGNVHINKNLTILNDLTVLGSTSADMLTINASINSNLVPDQNAVRDLGSPAYYWDDVYVDNLVANNISAASTTISGTASDSFTLNSNNATSDTEGMDLVFFRGTVVPNALVTWDSTLDKFDINQPFFIQNDSSTTTIPSLDVKGTSGQTADLFRVSSSASTHYFSIDSNGRVGVGTSSPDVLLHVGDNITEHISGSEDTMLSGALEVDGAAWFDGSLRASSTLLVTGISTFYGNTVLGDATSDTVTYTARVASHIIPSAADSYNLGSAALYWNELHVDTITATTTNLYGNLTIGDANADILTIRSGDWNLTSTATTTVAMTNGINFDGNTFVIDPNSGRVGIGTSSPASALHIAKTTEQLRLGYNGQNYVSYTVGATGDLTIAATGGDISFSDENLATTGNINMATASSTGIVKFAQIYSDTGAISFNDENLTTTGQLSAEHLISTDDADINDNLTVGDIIIDEAAGVLAFSGNTSASILTTSASNNVLTMGGANQTNNENLTFDFETTANKVLVSTGTGVTSVDFGTINLETDYIDVSSGTIANVNTISYADGQIVGTGSNAITIGDAGDTLALSSSDWAISTAGALTGITGITNDGSYTQTGTGTFSTGTGAISLNGATSVTGSNTFTVGTGLTTLGGDLSVTGTAWTATPTISGQVTMTSGFDSNAASTVAGLTVDGNGNLTVSNGTLSVTAPSTTGNATAITANSLTTGTGLNISSTSTAGGASGTSKLLNIARSGANAQLAHTAYGVYSSVINTNATSGTNIAGYFSASGATTANYGLIVENGNVGIGTAAPQQPLHVEGQCVTGDTELRIKNQELRIKNGEDEFINAQIKDVKAGDYVLSLNEKTGELEPARIKGLLDMGVKPIYKLTTESGKTIRTTGNHPYLARIKEQGVRLPKESDSIFAETGGEIFNNQKTVSDETDLSAENNIKLPQLVSDVFSGSDFNNADQIFRFGDIKDNSNVETDAEAILAETPGEFFNIPMIERMSKFGKIAEFIFNFSLNENRQSQNLLFNFFINDELKHNSYTADTLRAFLRLLKNSSPLTQPSLASASAIIDAYRACAAGELNSLSHSSKLSLVNSNTNSSKIATDFFVLGKKTPTTDSSLIKRGCDNLVNFFIDLKVNDLSSGKTSKAVTSRVYENSQPSQSFSTDSIISEHTSSVNPQEAKWVKVAYLREGMKIAVVKDSAVKESDSLKESDSGVEFEKIVSIEQLPAEQVYDIEVEGTHNFVANGIIAHNTYINSVATDANIKGLQIAQSGAITGTGYGLHVAKTGASTTNVGGYFSASGATNNYGLIVENGNVGIGTSSPASALHIAKTTEQLRLGYNGQNYVSYTVGAAGDVVIAATGGDISFSDENLATTGNINMATASSTGIVKFAQIYSDTGAISFNDENLTTTGQLSAEHLISTDDADINDNLTVGDIIIDEAAGVLAFSGNTSASILTTSASNNVLTMGGANQTNNENLTFDFETTANKVLVSTGTGVTSVDFGTINLETDYIDVSSGTIANVNTISYADGQIVGTGSNAITIGDAGDTLALSSSDWAISTAGALTGITGITNDGSYTQTGTGTFSTGTGAISLNGATSVTGSNTFTVGTGLTTLGGDLTVTGTAWTATPTISGQVTMTLGFDSNAASTVAGLTVDGNGNLTVSNGTLSVTAPSTTGNATAITANSLTSGNILSLTSNSTAAIAGNTGLNIAVSGANGAAAITRYGLKSAVTATNATSGTNIAGYFSASGATTANYGLIVANGNVGIGTTAPQQKFDVYETEDLTDGEHLLGIFDTGTGATAAKLLLGYRSNGSAVTSALIRAGSNDDLTFGTTATTQAMVIQNAGNVGIGSTAPDKALEINSATGGNLRLTYNDSNGAAAYYSDFAMSSSGDLTISASGGDISFSDENLATTGQLSAEHLISTDDADINDNLTVGDIIIDEAAGVLAFSGNTSASILTTSASNNILTLGGLNQTNNENLTFDFETTANKVLVSTGTGVTSVDFGTINLETDYIDVSSGTIANVNTISYADGQIVGTGSNAITIGDAGDTLALSSSDWAVSTEGALTGITGITNDGSYTQTGTGTFSTGTGAISLNGATSVTGSNTFTVGTGLTTLGGNLSVTGTAWTATPTISGQVTMTSGFDSNAASTVAGLTVDTDGNLTVSNGTLSVTAPSTTGNAAAITANSLTTGTGLNISSTSTAGGASGTSKLLNIARSGANAQLAHTAYGVYSSVTNTNVTSGTNIAGYFSASGATTANYGLIVENGNVGIGDASPAALLTVGANDLFQVNSSGAIAAVVGITNTGSYTQTGTGTFSTGTGAISLNGATSVTGSNTFTVGTGLTTLGGDLSVTGTAWTATPTISGQVTMTSGFDSNAASTVAGLTVDTDGNLTVSNGTLSVTAPSTTGNAAAITANSLTSGNILSLTSNSTAAIAGNTGLNIAVSGANGTAAITRYGLKSAVTATNATSGTNIAGYFSASGATTANYGLIVENGNVGIGTTAPLGQLDIYSSATWTDTSNAQVRISRVNNEVETPAFEIIDENSNSYLKVSSTGAGDADKGKVYINGNVGIGTVVPSGILSVTPSQYSTGTASQSLTTVTGVGTTWTSAMVGSQFVYANGTNGGTITAFGSTTSLTVSTSQTVTSQAYKIAYTGLQVATTGNIGIGTTAPDKALEINSATGANLRLTYNDSDGAATYYSDFAMSDSGDLTISASGGDISFSNENLATTGQLSAEHLISTDDADINDNLTVGDIIVDEAAGVLSFTGATSGKILTTAGDLYIESDGSDKDIYFKVNDGGVDTTVMTMDGSASRIGIGTTTPNNMLDIYSATKSAIGFSGASGSTYKWTMGMDVSNGGRFAIASSTALGTTDRFVILGNGNVGIGTTNPAAMLHSLSTTEPLRLAYDASNYASLIVGTAGELYLKPSMDTDDYFTFKTDTGVPTIFATGSYLRIGDAGTTGHTLDTEDDLMATGDLEVDGTAWFDGSLRASSTLLVTGAATMYSTLGVSGAVTLSDDLTVTSGARIGTGSTGTHLTALANDSLFVEGESEFDGTAWFDGSLRASSTLMVTGEARFYSNIYTGALEFGTDAGLVTAFDMPVSSSAVDNTVEGYNFAVDGTNILTVYSQSDGLGSIDTTRVGIGTTAPSAKLHAIETTEQLRLGYDAANYVSHTVGATGDLTIAASGGDISFSDENLITTGNINMATASSTGIVKFSQIYSDTGAVSFNDENLTTTGQLSAEHLISTDDADINDNLTVGDIIIDEAAGVLSFTGATSGKILATAGDLYIENDASDKDVIFKVNDGGVDTTVMTMDGATGYVGIGTTGPLGALDISKGAANSVQYISAYSTTDGDRSILKLLKSSSGTVGTMAETVENEALGSIQSFGVESDLGYSLGSSEIAFEQDAASTASRVPGRIAFKTTDSTNVLVERMRINNLGNVGIGTTTPNNVLSVYKTSADAAVSFGTGSVAGANRWVMGMDYSDGNKFKIASSTALGTSDRFVIAGNGNVGIGTAVPGRIFTTLAGRNDSINRIQSTEAVVNTISAGLEIGNSAGGWDRHAFIQALDGDFKIINEQTGKNLYLTTTGTGNVLIDNGNVGIGTTTPTSLMQVAGATAPKITLSDTNASANQKHWFMESDTGGFGIGTTSDALVTNTSYRALKIDSAGDVGIGSSTPESKLAVQANEASKTALTVRQDGAGNIVEFKDGATTVFSINGSGNLAIGASGKEVAITSTNWSIDTTGTTTGSINLSSGSLTVIYKPATVSLAPEYQGAVYYADGGSNSGTLTSEYDTTTSPDRNYYQWTTSSDNQDYDIVVRWLVPEDFYSFDNTYGFKVYSKVSDASGNSSMTFSMRDTSDTAVTLSASVKKNTSWTQDTFTYSGSPTFTASNSTTPKWITFQIKLTADNADTADVGEISFRYNRRQ